MRRPSPFPVPRFYAASLAVVLAAAPFFAAQGQATTESTAATSPRGLKPRSSVSRILRSGIESRLPRSLRTASG